MQASLAARGSFLSGAKVASVARPQLRVAPVAVSSARVVALFCAAGRVFCACKSVHQLLL